MDTEFLKQISPDLFKQFFSLAGTGIGISRIDSGTDLEVKGFELAANSNRSIAAFNARLDQINTNRQLTALGREIRSLSSTQTAQAASSGFSVASKSTLAVMSDSLNQFERNIKQIKFDAEQRQKAILFEGEVSARNNEIRARAAKARGEAEKQQAQADAIGQVVKIGLTLAAL